jgi:GTP cyclohydrolase I
MSVDLDSADQDFRQAMDLHRRQISEAQMLTFEGFMAEILTAFGMELNTPVTGETPRRFIRALFDITDGFESAR